MRKFPGRGRDDRLELRTRLISQLFRDRGVGLRRVGGPGEGPLKREVTLGVRGDSLRCQTWASGQAGDSGGKPARTG